MKMLLLLLLSAAGLTGCVAYPTSAYDAYGSPYAAPYGTQAPAYLYGSGVYQGADYGGYQDAYPYAYPRGYYPAPPTVIVTPPPRPYWNGQRSEHRREGAAENRPRPDRNGAPSRQWSDRGAGDPGRRPPEHNNGNQGANRQPPAGNGAQARPWFEHGPGAQAPQAPAPSRNEARPAAPRPEAEGGRRWFDH